MFTEMNKNLKEMNTKTNNRQATVKRQLIHRVTYTAYKMPKCDNDPDRLQNAEANDPDHNNAKV